MYVDKIYSYGAYNSKIQNILNTYDVARRTGYNFRYVSQLCRAGHFPGAYQVRGQYGKMEWRIPIEYVPTGEPIGPRGHYAHVQRVRRVIDIS